MTGEDLPVACFVKSDDVIGLIFGAFDLHGALTAAGILPIGVWETDVRDTAAQLIAAAHLEGVLRQLHQVLETLVVGEHERQHPRHVADALSRVACV